MVLLELMQESYLQNTDQTKRYSWCCLCHGFWQVTHIF